MNQDPRKYLETIKDKKNIKIDNQLLGSIGSLAPSTHNTQPWLLGFEKGILKIMPNLEMQIPEADPINRYLFISLGAFSANVKCFLDATRINYKFTVSNSGVIIFDYTHITIKNNNKIKNSLKKILDRQNYRGEFDSFNNSDFEGVNNLVNNNDKIIGVYDEKRIHKAADATAEGVAIAYGNKKFRSEISSLINSNKSDERIGLHGYSLKMNNSLSIILPKIMKRFNIGKLLGKLNKKSFNNAGFACVIVNSKKSKEKDWIETGIIMEKLFLEVTKYNWQASIFVASLENESTLQKIKTIFKTEKNIPEIFFLLGKVNKKLKNSKRQQLDEVVMS